MKSELLRRLEDVVWVDPDRLSGVPCFKGTRIPVHMLIDHLTAGFSLDEFLETVPTLERSQAQRFLELAGEQIQECGVLLDECVNPRLRLAFPGDEVKTVHEMGWRSFANGRLMNEAAPVFRRVQFTLDLNLQFQNPTGKHPLGIVVLITRFNDLAAYRPQFSEIRDLARQTRPGQVNVLRSGSHADNKDCPAGLQGESRMKKHPRRPVPLGGSRSAEATRQAYAKRDRRLDSDLEAPQLSPEYWANAVVGKYYRPLKTQISFRIDNEVLDWLKSKGAGHLSRINEILRERMARDRR